MNRTSLWQSTRTNLSTEEVSKPK